MLRGERIRLRALEVQDAEVVWRWHQDHEFHVLDGWLYPASLAQMTAWVQSVGTPSFHRVFLGIETESGALVGVVSLKRAEAEHRNADFGIAIERAYWDKGYGTDATRTMLRFAFAEMGLHRVTLGVVDYNARAQRVYEKCGFQVEGRVREAKLRDGRWCDAIIMGILDREFLVLEQQTAHDRLVGAVPHAEQP